MHQDKVHRHPSIIEQFLVFALHNSVAPPCLFFRGICCNRFRIHKLCRMPFKHGNPLAFFFGISIASAQWEAASHVVGHSTKVDHKLMTCRFYVRIWGPSLMEILCVPELVLNRLSLFGFADLTYAKCELESREPPEFQISVLHVLCVAVHLELVSCPLEAPSLEEHGSCKAVWKHSIYLHLRHLLYSLQLLKMKLFFCGCTSDWNIMKGRRRFSYVHFLQLHYWRSILTTMTLDLVVWNTREASEVFIVREIGKRDWLWPEQRNDGTHAQSCDLNDPLGGAALSPTFLRCPMSWVLWERKSSTVCRQHQVCIKYIFPSPYSG